MMEMLRPNLLNCTATSRVPEERLGQSLRVCKAHLKRGRTRRKARECAVYLRDRQAQSQWRLHGSEKPEDTVRAEAEQQVREGSQARPEKRFGRDGEETGRMD
ncbi:hypothetical protein GN956_G16245 [Arapaima gigas]